MVNKNNSQAETQEIEYDNLLDYFDFYLAPLAIRLGQPVKEFWEDDPDYFWNYLDAYNKKEELRLQYDNTICHLMGEYVMLAYNQAWSPKKEIYPKKPVDIAHKKSNNSNNSKESINNKWLAYLQNTLK